MLGNIQADRLGDHGSTFVDRRKSSGISDDIDTVQPQPETSSAVVAQIEDEEQTKASLDLNEEEHQLLKEENEKLYTELTSIQSEVQQVETKVLRIAELQEVFTEKVLEQKGSIELVADNAVAATENVKDGNEELRKAIQNQASVRVYVLFFLIVMSFSLLFLDWYNE